jgi:hypothetical protein
MQISNRLIDFVSSEFVLGVAKRYGISIFQLVEHISPQRQEESL